MKFQPSRRTAITCALLAGLAAGPSAEAAGRRFEPVPASTAQVVQVVGESTIISAAGKQFHAGASLTPSGRRAWLSVSVKNVGATALGFGDDAVVVLGNDQPLAILSEEAAVARDSGYGQYDCGPLAPKSDRTRSNAQANCAIDKFNGRQAKRASEGSAENAAAQQLAAGKLEVRRFQVDLPRKPKSGSASLKVNVTVGGEQLSFDFKEVES